MDIGKSEVQNALVIDYMLKYKHGRIGEMLKVRITKSLINELKLIIYKYNNYYCTHILIENLYMNCYVACILYDIGMSNLMGII